MIIAEIQISIQRSSSGLLPRGEVPIVNDHEDNISNYEASNDDHEENIDYDDIKEDRINQNALFRMPCPC